MKIQDVIIIFIFILSGCAGGNKAKMQRNLDDLQNQIFDIQQDYIFVKNRLLRQANDIEVLEEIISSNKNQGNNLLPEPINKENKTKKLGQKVNQNGIVLYKKAKGYYRAGDMEKAISSFKQYIKSYPKTSYSDNAQYWVGECYYNNKNFKQSVEEFNKVITNYPSGNKLQASLLKAGYCYYELKNYEKSLEVLQKLITKKTETMIYNKAQKKIDQILSVR